MTIQKKVLSSLMLALFAFAAAAPASAQYWDPGATPGHDGRIPPQQIEAMVRSMGFQPVADPRVRGPLWVTHAVDRDGQQVRVLIDGYSGRMIDVLRRPTPPQRVAFVPPPSFPPSFGGSPSGYGGPDYDYRDMPEQRPADWPPPYPNAQHQQPNVVPFPQRGHSDRAPAPSKTKTTKKKETRKKVEQVAALKPDKEKADIPSPALRPQDAPKADAPKQDAPKQDAPKTAEVPTFVPNADQRPASSALPPVQPLEMKKSEPSTALPTVQPVF